MGADKPMSAKLCAEFIGTYFLVFTVSCNVLSGTSGAFVALSIAASLMVSVYALAGVSGANFNPAVSVALSLSGKQAWSDTIYYILIQVLAGCMAAVSGSMMFGRSFNLAPGAGYSWKEACGAEVLYTFMLCTVVLNTAAASKRPANEFAGLAIGFVIVAAGYACGFISGANLNPAVSIGIDAASAQLGFGWSVAYTGFQLVGAALAALVFMALRPEEFPGSDRKKGIAEECFAEFLGTFILVLTVGLNVIGGSMAAALSIAASLMCMIYAFGDVSGAHFNPAVTFALWASGERAHGGNKRDVPKALKFCASQLAGGLVAGITYHLLTKGKSFPLGPGTGHSWVDAFVAEALFTFVLCFTVLAVASVEKANSNMFGMAIGFCVVVGGFAAGGISGGSLNPAVSFGIDATHALASSAKLFNCFAYTCFELVGAALAAIVFQFTHTEEYELPAPATKKGSAISGGANAAKVK